MLVLVGADDVVVEVDVLVEALVTWLVIAVEVDVGATWHSVPEKPALHEQLKS